jgi:hypothetical protein
MSPRLVSISQSVGEGRRFTITTHYVADDDADPRLQSGQQVLTSLSVGLGEPTVAMVAALTQHLADEWPALALLCPEPSGADWERVARLYLAAPGVEESPNPPSALPDPSRVRPTRYPAHRRTRRSHR